VLAAMLAVGGEAHAAPPCRGYAASAARALKSQVDALRLLEREAADRLAGLDTRTYDYLAGQAQRAADAIGEAKALAEEDGLDRCPEPVPHIRRVCAIAARALLATLTEQVAETATPPSKQAYREAMPICEGLIGLAPLRTAWRMPD
jgi:hypothetical protein